MGVYAAVGRDQQHPPGNYARKRATEYAESIAERVDEKDKATIINALTLPEEDMPDAALRRTRGNGRGGIFTLSRD